MRMKRIPQNKFALVTIPHTGRHYVEHLLRQAKREVFSMHALPAVNFLSGSCPEYPTVEKVVITLRDPAAQYASCVRRYGVKAAYKWSIPNWEALPKLNFDSIFWFRLEDQDIDGLYEYVGLDRPKNLDTTPQFLSGAEPSVPGEYPPELDEFRQMYGYPTAETEQRITQAG